MLGRTPGTISAIRPLKDGVIADFDVTEQMLRHFIQKVHQHRFAHPRVVVCVPSGVTGVEKRAVEEATLSAGARQAYLIEEPMAAAIGAGPPGGRADREHDRRHRGRHDRGRRDLARRHRRLAVLARRRRRDGRGDRQPHEEGVQAARSASRRPRRSSSRSARRGRCPRRCRPRCAAATCLRGCRRRYPQLRGVRRALEEPVAQIVDAIKPTLDKTPPELAADIMDRGIVLAGGGALLHGLDERLRHETQMPAHLAESPLTCVAVGSGRSLEEFEAIHRTQSRPRPAERYAASGIASAAARGARPPSLWRETTGRGIGARSRRVVAYTACSVPRNRSSHAGGAGRPRPAPRRARPRRERVRRLRRRHVLVVLNLPRFPRHALLPRAGGRTAALARSPSTALRPFEVAADRVLQPFRDADGEVSGLFDKKRRSKRRGREPRDPPGGDAEQIRRSERTRSSLAARLPRAPGSRRASGRRRARRLAPADPFEQRIVDLRRAQRGDPADDPVVTHDGLVGKVTDGSPKTSAVTLLTDEKIAVSAKDLDGDAAGIVRHGHAPAEPLVSTGSTKGYVVKRATDRHLGKRGGSPRPAFPQGITIGVVTFVGQNGHRPYKQIQVRLRRLLVARGLLVPGETAVIPRRRPQDRAARLRRSGHPGLHLSGSLTSSAAARPAAGHSSRSRCSAGRRWAPPRASPAGSFDLATFETIGVTSLLLTLTGYWIGRYGETTGRGRTYAPSSRPCPDVRRRVGRRVPLPPRRPRLGPNGARHDPDAFLAAVLVIPIHALCRWLLRRSSPRARAQRQPGAPRSGASAATASRGRRRRGSCRPTRGSRRPTG